LSYARISLTVSQGSILVYSVAVPGPAERAPRPLTFDLLDNGSVPQGEARGYTLSCLSDGNDEQENHQD